MEYWPYGEVRSRTGSTPTKFLFAGTLGYFADGLTRLYVRARHYLAQAARWLTADPLWPGRLPAPLKTVLSVAAPRMRTPAPPAYGYAWEAPVEYVDSSGRRPIHSHGEDLPNFGRGIFGYPNYGNYCGASTVCTGDTDPPKDCIDKACQFHDTCLETTRRGGGGIGWFDSDAMACHCLLAVHAAEFLELGCGWGIVCRDVALDILVLFGAACVSHLL